VVFTTPISLFLHFFTLLKKSTENMSFQNFVAIFVVYDVVARKKLHPCRDDVPSTHTKYERVAHA